ncbi:carboxymuconolactone decarboxylase family protein [Streptomyces sp. TRM76323]|uniref:Carboxymuconolactone decarboxylase family protein n=1 Tax=Streptomyces tamarix TaxID=3078565 RepID=A0ABU3QK28_9ACTN|nr:carboxymuconolactone decarboxylase family protein [Streptomyces tamarix]MDT9683106.1 carboxymuconolactone decarboxylase family protein [Streptomyces tamarix]
MTDETRHDRMRRGRALMNQVNPRGGEQMLREFAGLAPDFEELLLGFVFADVYDRPVLSLRERQLIRIAALTALDAGESAAKANLSSAVNLGIPTRDIVEALLQTLPYAGFPRVITALEYAKDVLEDR